MLWNPVNVFEESGEKKIKRLIKIRKAKKRTWIHPYKWQFKKLPESWRKPRGIDNKVRLQIKGKPPLVKSGYRSPRMVRYLHPTGKEVKLVRNVQDLYNIDPLTQVVRIAGTVGIKKRLEILNFAHKFGIKVLNPGKAEPKFKLAIEGFEEFEEFGEEESAVVEELSEKGIEAISEEEAEKSSEILEGILEESSEEEMKGDE